MRILLADSLHESALDALVHRGHDVVYEPKAGSGDLPDLVGGVNALVVRSTKVTAAAIEAADSLDLVVRAGSGVDNIDVATASSHAVKVCNVPGRNAAAVAELTMGLLLAVDRGIADGTAELRAGSWDKSRFQKAGGLMGRTLGIIGLGEIGLGVAARARAFGMHVIGVRRANRSAEVEQRIRQLGIRLVASNEALADASDVLSVHVPKSPSTVGLVSADLLARLRPGAILLNTARGEVVDEVALLDALDRGVLRAGLDVYPDEPKQGTGDFTSRLASHPNVVGTHHIGASTDQAQESVAAGVVEVIDSFVHGAVINCLNLQTSTQAPVAVRVRHRDRVGVLASVLAVLSESGLNVQEMENRVFLDSEAAVATIRVQGAFDGDVRSAVRAVDDVLGVSIIDVPEGHR